MSETQHQQQIHARLAKVLAEVEAIEKDRRNEQQGFRFRGIDDVYNALHDLFAKNQIYVLPEILEWKQADRQTAKGTTQIHTVVRMRYHFTTIDGSERITETPGEAADTGDKGLGKACQYAYKLALLQMFLVPTEGDNDPDAHAVEWSGQRDDDPPRRQPAAPAPPAAGVPVEAPKKGWRERIAEAESDQVLRELTAQIVSSTMQQEKKEILLRMIAEKEAAASKARRSAG